MPATRPRRTRIMPPPAPRRGLGKAINLHLQPEDIRGLDEIAARMKGSRSDAIRWMLGLAADAMKVSGRSAGE